MAGPHFETTCRDWAQSSPGETFGAAPGEVAAGVAGDPLRRSQIQVDVAVFAPDDSGTSPQGLVARRLSGTGPMPLSHLARLRRARDLLAVKDYDMSVTRLACYGGAGFDHELGGAARADPAVRLIGLDVLYG